MEDLRSRFALPLMATAAASSTVVRLWQPQRPDELLHVKPPSWSRKGQPSGSWTSTQLHGIDGAPIMK